ncbi:MULTISPECIES: restriction endonuclease [unclassified Bradyrhizobium]
MSIEERPIWGIHMGRDFNARPIDENFVAIGWAQVGDLSKVAGDREAFKAAVAKTYSDIKPGAIPVVAGTLFKFAREMRSGDRIIYPSKVDRKINLGFIDGEYLYKHSERLTPNVRRVKWVKRFDRTDFSQSALYEIGSAVTLFQVRNNADEFLAAFEGRPLETADVDAELPDGASSNAGETTEDFIIKRLKSSLTSYQFEKFVAHLLERMGYRARVTRASGDGGIDVIAHRDELGFEGIVKVQCKQTLSTIGEPDLSQLYGHVQAGEFALFVTLGDYSTQALHYARNKPNIRLIGGDDLVRLITDHYEKFEPRYQALLPLKRVYLPSLTIGDDIFD